MCIWKPGETRSQILSPNAKVDPNRHAEKLGRWARIFVKQNRSKSVKQKRRDKHDNDPL